MSIMYWICQRRRLKKTHPKYSYGIAIDRRFNPQRDDIKRQIMTVDGPIVENAFNPLVC